MTNATIVLTKQPPHLKYKADINYIGYLKPMLSAIPNTFVIDEEIQYLVQLTQYCKQKNVSKIISTSPHLLWKLLEKDWPANLKKRPAISDYAGSVFDVPGIPGGEIVFIHPLRQLITKPEARFTCERFISKITSPHKWHEPTPFEFTTCNTVERLNEALSFLTQCKLIAVDIETVRQHASISCVGYTGALVDNRGNVETRSFVVPFTSTFNLVYIRRINALAVAKIFQNGKYDNAYFLRFNAPVTNWIWDTAHLFHSWYSEMPKDLGFLNAFFLRKIQYWKDLSKTGDKFLYYKYNALDSWVTLNVFLIQIKQMPAWARRNYELEFPLVFPCLLSEMTGVRRDTARLLEANKTETIELAAKQKSLDTMLGTPYFNTNSGPQVKALLKVLGLGSFAQVWKDGEEKESANEIVLKKAMLAHPFGASILALILDIRGIRKNISTYLTIGDKAKEFHGYPRDGQVIEDGRILYALNPHGTNTGRLASNEHQFWCGLNFQTAPREGSYKTTIGSDPEFLFAECDLKQAESRGTANISGDSNLLAALDSGHDFHAYNASSFFGTPYALIFDDATAKILNKKLRDLAKRVNHGANYNMGALVLIDTMGLDKIYEARRLLNLPQSWTPLQIANHLLAAFHRTYPGIAGTYYPWVIRSVTETNMLISRAMHHIDRTAGINPHEYIANGDWTRYCFARPSANGSLSKRDLNTLVAHCPQSLNARTLNEAYLRVFYDLALGNEEFRLHAQIHDSILYSFKEGLHMKYCPAVKERMEIPVTIKSCDGKYRTFTVPADTKAGKDGRGAKYWSETE